MSINSIDTPYKVFTDVDGSPLEDGYVYVGEPNQNPEIVPINAFWDSSLVTPAAQPFRTLGGYVSRSGTPAVVYVEGDYSITVRNKNGSLIYTSPVATGILSSINSYNAINELIGYTSAPDGTSVNVTGYYIANDGGGDIFNFDESVDKSTADAGIIIDPSVSLANQGTGVGLGCWVRQNNNTINGKWFGVKGDITTDDSTSLENAIAAAENAFGGVLSIKGCGTIRLTRELSNLYRAVKIIGDGRLGVYPYESAEYTSANKLSTIYVDHNDRNAFKLYQNGSARGISFEGVNFIRKTGSTCVSALGFDTAGTVTAGENYGYDIVVKNCGIFDFDSAIDLYVSTTSTEPTMAAIQIEDCAINRNGYIARTLNSTAWNGFTFINNKAGQQTVGGIDVSAHKFEEHGNYLEGCPNPIKASGGYRGFNSHSSYFEANTGIALIELSSVRAPKIGTHTILSNSALMKVRAKNIGLMNCDIPYIGEEIYKNVPPQYGNSTSLENDIENIDTITYGVCSSNVANQSMVTKPSGVLTYEQKQQSGINFHRADNPITGKPMAVEQYTTASTGIKVYTTTIAGNIGDYVSVSLMVRAIPDGLGEPSPLLTLNVNGTAAGGTRDYTFAESNLYFAEGDWMVLHAVIKLTASMTSLDAYIYPYGINPTAGRVAEIMPPSIHTTLDLKNCKPFFDVPRLESLQVIPTTGTWERGDRFFTTTPIAGGFEGWECVVAGSPGTWKEFGTIAV